MAAESLPYPKIDALPMGAHRLFMLTDQALFEQAGVRIGFTSRDGGVSEGAYASLNTAMHVDDDPARVARNRAIVAEAVGCDDAPIVVPNQVHGSHIVTVQGLADAPRAQEEASEGADAVVVASTGVATLLSFADCLPLIIVSPTGRFAVAHAGWRGAVAGIAGKAVQALAAADQEADEPIPAAEFNAYIGPHICAKCFEVSEDVSSQFIEKFGASASPDPRHVSLANAVAADLNSAGLSFARIKDCEQCTMCHPDKYYSYRASNSHCGRHAAIAFREKAHLRNALP